MALAVLVVDRHPAVQQRAQLGRPERLVEMSIENKVSAWLRRKRPSPSALAISASRASAVTGSGRPSTASARSTSSPKRLVVEAAEDQHLAARQQGGVELEAGVLGRRADQGHRAVLDIGQEAVLLRAIEAVDLVHEQQGLLAGLGHLAASAKIFLRSATPEKTAEMATKRRPTASASRRAMLVLPVPGGPHRIIEDRRPAATIRPIAPSGPVRCSWPTTSPSVAGRSRSASGRVGRRRLGRGRVELVVGEQVGHRRQHNRRDAKNCTRPLATMQLRYILDASRGG